MQVRARALQDATVRGVPDERVMEPQRRLAGEGRGIGFDQLAPSQRLEPPLEVAACVGRQEIRDGGAGELAPDDCRSLEHDALLRTEALDAGREQRVDRRRHLQVRRRDADRPAVALAAQHAVVHEHAHELADVERVALARGEHAARDRGR